MPVDVFGEDTIKKISQTDTLEILQTLIPSYSVARSANTTSDTFIRSPQLRGLAADETLLLVNGHRRHKSASVGVSGYASQAADSAVIPAIALKSINVLRDGAAAQYGSDAIAGVIDYELKDADHGGSLLVQGGQYYAGDGTSIEVAGNIGMKLTDHGFINLSAQLNHDDPTIRARTFTSSAWDPFEAYQTDPDFAAAVDTAGLDLSKPLEKRGKPMEKAARFFVNSGLDLGDSGSLYAFGNFSKSKGTAAATYRVPGAGQAVLDNPIRLDDGSIYRFKEKWPLGMEPYFSGVVTDWSATGGWKDKVDLGGGQTLAADISARYGWDKIAYSIRDTENPSMGPDSPTAFNASSYVSDELSFNADFVYTLPTSFTHGPLVVNFGSEYRREGFKIEPGDETSYEAGKWAYADPFSFCTTQSDFSARTLTASAPTDQGIDCTNPDDPVYNVLQPGSNGITGLSPEVSGSWTTDSKSIYGEVTSDITKRWFLDLAARFENYQSFGSKAVWKVATRYNLTDWLGVRGSIGTGFRAPTAGQLHMTQTSIQTSGGVQLNVGLYPATNAVAQYLGAQPLKPEKSKNYSAGITLTPARNLTMTIDAYRIKLEDQLYTSSQIVVTDAIRQAMENAGIVGADSIDRIQFYQNALDSTTKGLDVVASYRARWLAIGPTSLMAAFNTNSYKVDKVLTSTISFNSTTIYNFEHNNPKWRANATINQQVGPVSVMVRANLYGPWSRQTTASSGLIQHYGTEPMFDIEFSVPVKKRFVLAVGANDLFDDYPDVNRIDDTNGRTYVDGPVPWQGGYYYGRITFNF
ncbi:TonB-dependent receptor plug domain-containing protein [Hephaestia mangrovi]|uniref:TonB-dependent receptor plug domain-containing protein n=1 Tax=Hephaestia mangrovi TaxID=2873268 RepID=UPI001CA6C165|nr:TonB-dependent receptor [Hephaestia mangrovi]